MKYIKKNYFELYNNIINPIFDNDDSGKIYTFSKNLNYKRINNILLQNRCTIINSSQDLTTHLKKYIYNKKNKSINYNSYNYYYNNDYNNNLNSDLDDNNKLLNRYEYIIIDCTKKLNNGYKNIIVNTFVRNNIIQILKDDLKNDLNNLNKKKIKYKFLKNNLNYKFKCRFKYVLRNNNLNLLYFKFKKKYLFKKYYYIYKNNYYITRKIKRYTKNTYKNFQRISCKKNDYLNYLNK